MQTLNTTRRTPEITLRNGSESRYDQRLIAGLTERERARVLPVMQAASRRAEAGNYTFTDKGSVDQWERQSRPTATSLGAEPGLEGRHHNDVEAARAVMSGRGMQQVFDAHMKESNARFLSRRRAETAEVKGDTVAEILDWAGSSQESAYITGQIGRAAAWLKAKRLADIAKQPFFKRMGSRIGRLRSYLGNDHPEEHIDVMASAVALLNKQGPRERVTGAELLAAVRCAFPDAFAQAGSEDAVLPPGPEYN